MVLGPMPCSCSNCFSVYFDSCFKVVRPLASKARRAGADTKERKPLVGLFCCSQMGQVGHVVLL